LKKTVEEKLATLKETVKTDKHEDIKNKTQELSEAIQKVSAELYKDIHRRATDSAESK